MYTMRDFAGTSIVLYSSTSIGSVCDEIECECNACGCKRCLRKNPRLTVSFCLVPKLKSRQTSNFAAVKIQSRGSNNNKNKSMILPMNTKFPFRFVPLTLALLLIAARETAGTKVVNLVASTNVTLFVAPSGSDTASGLSATDPLRTVSAAVSVANDRLYHAKASRVDVRLAPGAYAVVSDRAPFPISVSPGVHFWGDVVTGSAGVVWTFSGPGLEVAESSFQGIVFRNMSRDGAVKVTRNGASRYASSIAKFSNCSFEGSTDSHGASIGIAVVTDLHKVCVLFLLARPYIYI